MQNLSEKELEVLRYLTKGYNNQNIGEKMFLSIHTIKVYVTSIIRKLQAENRTHAVYIALKNNIID